MKVIVLGATGDMGKAVARVLARSADVTQLTLAGRNLSNLRDVAGELGEDVHTVAVDVRQPATLVEAMKGHDVAASAIGPAFLYETTLVKAAIEAGVHYVSIADDHDGVEAALQLDGAAKAQGVTVISGAGWTPGLTNLMAKKGMALLDEARDVHVAWAAASDFEGFAAMHHTLHILGGKVPAFLDGQPTSVPAGSGARVVRLPDPIGPLKMRYAGHPEPVTLPRFLPSLKNVTLRAGLTQRFLGNLAFLTAKITPTAASKAWAIRAMTPLLPLIKSVGRPSEQLSAAHVEVVGQKSGKPARVELVAVDGMHRLTAIPHAVITLMVGRGEVRLPGVVAPEAAGGPDPDQFLSAVAEHGLHVTIHWPDEA